MKPWPKLQVFSSPYKKVFFSLEEIPEEIPSICRSSFRVDCVEISCSIWVSSKGSPVRRHGKPGMMGWVSQSHPVRKTKEVSSSGCSSNLGSIVAWHLDFVYVCIKTPIFDAQIALLLSMKSFQNRGGVAQKKGQEQRKMVLDSTKYLRLVFNTGIVRK